MGEEVRKAPNIRFKGYEDDWEQRELNNYIETSKVKNSDGNYTKSDVLSVSGEVGIVNQIEFQGRSFAGVSVKNYGVVNNGNIVYTKSPLKLNPHGIIKTNKGKPGIVSTLYAVYIAKENTNPNFIQCYFESNYRLNKYLKPLVNKGAKNDMKVSDDNALLGLVVFPSYDEQTKISELFESLDNNITLHQRKLDLLKVTKKSMLQKMFPKDGERVPEIRFAGFTDEWEERKLGEMGDTFTGLSGKTKEDFGHGEAKFITYINVFGNVISNPKGVESVEIDNKQNQVKYGDVLFTTSSETPEEVGMASIWLEKTENVYLNSFCFGYRPNVEFDVYYLAFMLRSQEIRKKFMLLAQGISRYNISKNKVMEMNVLVPELNEQRKVGTFFRNLDNLITLHQRELDLLKDLKKSMLQQMFI